MLLIYLTLAAAFGSPLIFVYKLFWLIPLGLIGAALLLINGKQATRMEERGTAGEIMAIAGLIRQRKRALRAFREGVDGREQLTHVEREGATIAELPVFDDKPYPSTVAAEEEAVVLYLDKNDVKVLCLKHPQIAKSALKMLAGRLRKCAELVEALSLREVDQRLARWLMAEARSRGRRAGAGLDVTLVLTNQQIAARIGSVREVVSRALSRLQQNGLIQIDGRRGAVCGEQALEVFAGA
jgi:CRP/FNR family transcriptional regulator